MSRELHHWGAVNFHRGTTHSSLSISSGGRPNDADCCSPESTRCGVRASRATIARMAFRQLARDHAITRGMFLSFVHRTFFGRLRWLLTGQ